MPRLYEEYIDGLVQDSSISIANPLEILQYCTNFDIPEYYSNRV